MVSILFFCHSKVLQIGINHAVTSIFLSFLSGSVQMMIKRCAKSDLIGQKQVSLLLWLWCVSSVENISSSPLSDTKVNHFLHIATGTTPIHSLLPKGKETDLFSLQQKSVYVQKSDLQDVTKIGEGMYIIFLSREIYIITL